MIKSINVLGSKVKVKYKKDYIVYNNQNCFGLYRPSQKLIEIATVCDGKERNADDIKKTFYHELCHAICDRCGIHQTDFDWKLEEILAEAFGNVMSENSFEWPD